MPELRYHHIGIPTNRPLPKEDYIEQFKVYASGYFQSPYGVEWMKFEVRIAARSQRSRGCCKPHISVGLTLTGRTPVTPALLRLDPHWDPLRNDPRFQKLCEEKQQ